MRSPACSVNCTVAPGPLAIFLPLSHNRFQSRLTTTSVSDRVRIFDATRQPYAASRGSAAADDSGEHRVLRLNACTSPVPSIGSAIVSAVTPPFGRYAGTATTTMNSRAGAAAGAGAWIGVSWGGVCACGTTAAVQSNEKANDA